MISPARRTTIVASDMEKSLSFYRDTLGMKVFYDQEISAEATGKLVGVPGAKVRIVSLQEEQSTVGMVGLMSFLSPEIKPRQAIREVVSGPDTALLFMADDIDISATHEKVAQEGGVIVCPPVEYDVPERGPICGFTCYDPDGILVAIMRFGTLEAESGAIKASPIRRTSIVVGDMEKSLSFYRDTLGMRVFYDQVISSDEEGKMLGVPGARIRIVSLQAGDSVEGMVGLMSFLSPPRKPRREAEKAAVYPDIALVFVTDEIESLFERIIQDGWRVQCAPVEYEIPGRGICTGSSCFDPDGILVEFTQFSPLKRV